MEAQQVNLIPSRNQRSCRKCSSQGQRRDCCSSGSVGFFATCWRETVEWFCHLRNIQEELSDRKLPHERRFGSLFDGLWHNWNRHLLDKSTSRIIHRIRAESWRRLDWSLDHRGLARHREQQRVQSSRQKIQIQRSWNSRNAGSMKVKQCQVLRHQRVERSNATEGCPPLWTRRRGGGEDQTLCKAHRRTPYKMKTELHTFYISGSNDPLKWFVITSRAKRVKRTSPSITSRVSSRTTLLLKDMKQFWRMCWEMGKKDRDH